MTAAVDCCLLVLGAWSIDNPQQRLGVLTCCVGLWSWLSLKSLSVLWSWRRRTLHLTKISIFCFGRSFFWLAVCLSFLIWISCFVPIILSVSNRCNAITISNKSLLIVLLSVCIYMVFILIQHMASKPARIQILVPQKITRLDLHFTKALLVFANESIYPNLM